MTATFTLGFLYLTGAFQAWLCVPDDSVLPVWLQAILWPFVAVVVFVMYLMGNVQGPRDDEG